MAEQLTETLRYVRQVDTKPSAAGFAEGSIIFDTTEQAFYESVNDAWQLLDLNAAGDLLVDKLSFNTAAGETVGVGELAWNDTEKTLDLGVSDNVTIQLGQEEVIYVKNNSGVVIPNGAVVYVTGALGANVTVAMACANTGAACAGKVIGVATEELGINQKGFVATHGIVRGLDTTVDGDGVTLAEGDTVYLSTTLGEWVKAIPGVPDREVRVGYITRRNANNGELFVSIDNGFTLGEADNLDDSSVSDNSFVYYDSSAEYYKTKLLTISDLDDVDVTTAAPANGEYLQFNGSDWVPGISELSIDFTNVTSTSYTLAASDAGKFVKVANASGSTVTVASDSSVSFNIGDTVIVGQFDSGTVSVASGSGVTILSFGSHFDLAGEGATASLVKTGSNSWLLFGNLT